MAAWKDKWCLITGASSGIGAEFARQLAAAGARLILVARREDRLRELADALAESCGTESRVIARDLSEPTAADDLLQQTADVEVDVLINNAGFGHYGEFADMSPQLADDLLQLNVVSLVQVTHRFLPLMIRRRRGVIVHVASTASFQPLPCQTLYSASKAFVLHFSEGLWGEARKRGVLVQALCPGFTRTDFFDRAQVPDSVPFGTMNVEDVVSSAIKAMGTGRSYWIPGWLNYLLAMSTRLATRRRAVLTGAQMMKPGRHGR